eukprot:TRINITY_DN2035_c0_g1_i1.p1 TRINITY_DN2035_c0_g1~~TRINITY_DN2035_c0_g1_i1.p1  ORF type:complete len:353 (+),score=62.98 TRINITY_DN2035_c0_g1_i1:93-1151(+)
MDESSSAGMMSRMTSSVPVMCCIYMLSSAGMSISNKLAITSFPLGMSLVVVQMLFCDLVLLVKMRNEFPLGSRRDLLRWSLTIPPLFSGMLITSVFAFQTNALSTVVVCRNVAPLVAIFIEGVVQRVLKAFSLKSVAAILVTLCGVGLYEYDDLSGRSARSSMAGLGWMLSNMTLAVLERIAQRHMLAHDPVDISKQGLVLINNSVGLVLVALLALITGETAKLGDAVAALSSLDVFYVFISCVVGIMIGYVGIATQALISATSFMVLTNVNKFVVIGFGMVALGDSSSPQAILGCFVAILGGVWYARESAEADKQADARRSQGAAAETTANQPRYRVVGAPADPEEDEVEV